MNAYVLTWEDDCDEPCGEVVFADDEAAARAAGARFGLTVDDVSDITVHPEATRATLRASKASGSTDFEAGDRFSAGMAVAIGRWR